MKTKYQTSLMTFLKNKKNQSNDERVGWIGLMSHETSRKKKYSKKIYLKKKHFWCLTFEKP